MKLELKQIRLDGDTQPRVALNEETVQDYTEALMGGAVFPAAVVFHDGSSYWLADGFHRYFAHKRAGQDAIEVEIMNGTLRDAKLYSIGANAQHGLRRTNEDKRRAVLILLNDPEWSEWSDMEIARRACVSNATVHRVRKSLQLDEKKERKFTKNGVQRTMDVSKLSEKEEEFKPDPMQEMANELESVIEENKKLRENAVLELANIPEEEKLDIHEQLESYRHKIKVLETELTAVKRSRDTLQNENAELKKTVLYWKKQAQK